MEYVWIFEGTFHVVYMFSIGTAVILDEAGYETVREFVTHEDLKHYVKCLGGVLVPVV